MPQMLRLRTAGDYLCLAPALLAEQEIARYGMKRVKISHLLGPLGPVAAAVGALLLLTPGVAAAQAWTVVPSPAGGQLNGVASVSADRV